MSKGSYLVAYRFLEQAIRELEKINGPVPQRLLLQLKQPKRELEDLIW